MLNFLNKTISFSFYALFLVVPLTFAGDTSELFEFNKMWLTYGLAIIIAAAWISKMFVTRQFRLQRTLIDIPIGLFLLSQIVATVFSLDSYVSFWGYYSRFNGGLLSTITYIFLYYAFVSNVDLKQVIRYLYASVIAGVIVGLWGLPSHFGYDPTCLIFRGTLDVSCWTTAFQPKVRIFSTLGQPDWLAAYLIILTPIAFAFGSWYARQKKTLLSVLFFGATFLFYLDTLYTRARSGFLGMMAALLLLFGWYLWQERKNIQKLSILTWAKTHILSIATVAILILATFFVGSGIAQLDNFSLSGLEQHFASKTNSANPAPKTSAQTAAAAPTELGGTDSGKIRLFVWEGALKIWKDHPIIGTGVETFAFAYYLYRPVGHNLTSEWDYLYNKAHNEYLNYLATTGIFGLGSYLAILACSMWFMMNGLRKIQTKQDHLSSPTSYLLPALLASYVSILVTDFFGFSVVNTNIYLFLIPGFVFFLQEILPNNSLLVFPQPSTQNSKPSTTETSGFAWLGMTIVTVVGIYLIIVLLQYRSADIAYALGQNLDHVGEYQQAYTPLHQAVQARSDEPVFKDELSLNDAVLAAALASQNDTNAAKVAQEALSVSNDVVMTHPNNVVFWKTRVRVMYELSQLDPKYMQLALAAITTAQKLAPTDAKISYNLGLLQDQTGNVDQAIATLQNTVILKSDYQDAYYALGTFYRQKATNGGKTVVDVASEQKAVETMHYIFLHFDPNSKQVKDSLTSWGEK